ncbi:MAG: hypothetical protein PHZ19_01835 [Candidatus Thermoplasmatota archaeon]|nr:hypothetical protein [Candidatus Thermoplasmatota archaeon]
MDTSISVAINIIAVDVVEVGVKYPYSAFIVIHMIGDYIVVV